MFWVFTQRDNIEQPRKKLALFTYGDIIVTGNLLFWNCVLQLVV